MPGKTQASAEEIIAEKLEGAEAASKEAAATSKEGAEVLKSVAASLDKLVEVVAKNNEVKAESDVVLEMKSEVALMKAQMAAGKAAITLPSDEAKKTYLEKSKPMVEAFYNGIKQAANSSNAQIVISSDNFEFNRNKFSGLELKSIRSFDATSAGALLREGTSALGLIENNPDLTGGVISSLVRNISKPMSERYTFIDESGVTIDESTIMQAKAEGKAFKMGKEEITQRQFSAYSLVDDYLIHLAAAGQFEIDPIQKYLDILNRKFELKLDMAILSRIIERSQKTGTFINKAFTASTTPVLSDFSNAVTAFPARYTNGQIGSIDSMYMIVDAALTDSLFKSEGEDGHLKSEYYDYTIGRGIIAIKTGRGLLKLIPVEADYFGTYKLFDDAGAATATDNSGGYDAGGSNAGKILGIVADWPNAVALLRNPMSQIGIDAGLRYMLETGTAVAGKIGYAGTDVFFERKVSLLINLTD